MIFEKQHSVVSLLLFGCIINFFWAPSKTYSQDLTNLVAYWSFDENKGVTIYDGTVNGNNGTMFGARWCEGLIGNALAFDGYQSYIRISNSPSLSITDNFTIEAWIHTVPNGKDQVIIDNDNGANAGYCFGINGLGRLYFVTSNRIDGPKSTTSFLSIDDSQWHHVSMTYLRPSVVFHLDGLQDTKNLATTTIIGPPKSDLYIGRQEWNSGWFNGMIDELYIHNRALTEVEIKSKAHPLINLTIDYSFFPEEDPMLTLSPNGDLRNYRLNIFLMRNSSILYSKIVDNIISSKIGIFPEKLGGGIFNLQVDLKTKDGSKVEQPFPVTLHVLGGKKPALKYLLYVRGEKFSKIDDNFIATLNDSPYDGFAAIPVGAYDIGVPAYSEFSKVLNLISQNILDSKHVWPWFFFNRLVGCSSKNGCSNTIFEKINGLDILNETGALTEFYELFELSLKLAKAMGTPGIIFDHEAYNDPKAYSIDYLANKMKKPAGEIKQRLMDIGYRLADMIDNTYPSAVVIVLSYQPDQPRYHDTPGYVVDGMLEQAKLNKYNFTIVDGGEGTLWYTNKSLDELINKLIKRVQSFSIFADKYPNLKMGGTITLYEEIKKTSGWIRDWYIENGDAIQIKYLNDFIPILKVLFRTNEYVWIYGAGAADTTGGYDELDSMKAKAYRPAIYRALRGPSPPRHFEKK